MEIEIDLRKSLNENASAYFEKSKKAKKKLEGIEKTIPKMRKMAEKQSEMFEGIKKQEIRKKRHREWYEKFHWFFTSNGMLVIAGKDAKSNDSLIKKHMEKTDLYFHAEIFGAPHTILKSKDNSAPRESLDEAARFAGTFSSAWKHKIPSVDVYSVLPEQVSKAAPSGENIGTGAFMIYGKRQWYRKMPVDLAIGIDDESGRIVSGPSAVIAKKTKNHIIVSQGSISKGEFAKIVKKALEEKAGKKGIAAIDEILAMLPAGMFEIKR
jgi:predicted ribosome quality control (RQC) complex YloA/Tae2 family protein